MNTSSSSGPQVPLRAARDQALSVDSDSTVELVLIRHPAVSIASGICYGRSNVSLEAPLEASIEAVLAQWAASGVARPARLYSSPLDRCALVAARLAEQWAVPLELDADLIELDFGAWELRRWDEIGRPALDAWAADLEHARPHGGESAAAVADRAQRWLARACTDAPRVIVAVTHAGVIRMLASRLLGEPVGEGLRRPLEFGGICRFVR
ncbi:MAG TPA: alpha-ribazole phosphatase family protein, partial [Pararobbsia sp.]|nr:alpha-ribazole phosphatase family protein [Pararobbsia sp.]